MNSKKIKLFVVVENSMIWEAYSNSPVELIIQNNDKEWYRELEVILDKEKVQEAAEIVALLKDSKVTLHGLDVEKAKHVKVKRK